MFLRRARDRDGDGEGERARVQTKRLERGREGHRRRRERRREAERAVRVVSLRGRRRGLRCALLRRRLRRRARRRADHGVAVDLAVDRIKIRLILSEERGDDAADPPAWTSNIGCHSIDGNFHTATHSLYSASHWPSVQVIPPSIAMICVEVNT